MKGLNTAVLNGAGDRNRTYDPLITNLKSNVVKPILLKAFESMYFYDVSVFEFLLILPAELPLMRLPVLEVPGKGVRLGGLRF